MSAADWTLSGRRKAVAANQPLAPVARVCVTGCGEALLSVIELEVARGRIPAPCSAAASAPTVSNRRSTQSSMTLGVTSQSSATIARNSTIAIESSASAKRVLAFAEVRDRLKLRCTSPIRFRR
jgi:hypothetical protein